MIVTERQISRFNWVHVRHGNKGYPRDDNGEVIMRPGGEEPYHLGYVWTYRAEECRRLTFSDHIMHPDKADTRVWAVDGEDAPDMQGAIDALSRPPLLTMTEFVAWVRMGPNPVGYENVLAIIAGAINPTPNYIYPNTRWSTAARAIDGLKDKGMIIYDDPTHSYRRVNT